MSNEMTAKNQDLLIKKLKINYALGLQTNINSE